MIYIYEISFFRFWLYVAFYIGLAGMFVFGIMSAVNEPDAMEICQQTHSFDTCFEGLNR